MTAANHSSLLFTFIGFLPLLALVSGVSGNSGGPAPYNVTPEQIATYKLDGVIVIRGLLEGRELKGAIKAANRIQRRKGLGQRISYKKNPIYRNLEFQTWRKDRALEKVAFDSAAPTICAKLMGLDGIDSTASTNIDDKNNLGGSRSEDTGVFRPLRLLKDAVLGYSAGDKGCGWHVDDKIFWPCEDRNIGKRDAGANVWITLSTVTTAEGGGLAVAPGSHRLNFAKKARKAISSSASKTCILEKLAPDCHEQMEKIKAVYDLQPGDAIIHDRYIFHRTEAFLDPIRGKKAGTKQRISLRYVPADATFFNNQLTEARLVEEKGMATGDYVSKGAEYFPQTWPDRLPEERDMKVHSEENLFKALSQKPTKK